MKKSGLRHNNPLPIPRRGGSRLIEVKSPKLGRWVRLFEKAAQFYRRYGFVVSPEQPLLIF